LHFLADRLVIEFNIDYEAWFILRNPISNAFLSIGYIFISLYLSQYTHMSFVVSARKYRPANFDELVGQDHVSTTLKNAIQNDQLAHAFLFSGPRGVGKTSTARILAKVLNCQNKTQDHMACGECQACKSFADNSSFNIFELDAASNNSVEHIRNLNDQVRFQPQQGSYKIYIIDEVHMLSSAAFNAFLKTLEEPPPYAKFILATTEKHKIIPTILSRCQIFDFKRIEIKDIVSQLKLVADKEDRTFDDESLHLIAHKADGAMRDALSIYDKIASSVVGNITYKAAAENLNVLDYDYYFRMVDAAIKEDLVELMVIVDDIIRKGFAIEQVVVGMMEHLRRILFVLDVRTAALLESGAALQTRYEAQAALTTHSFLLTALVILEKVDIDLVRSHNQRLAFELALSKIAYMNRVVEKKNPVDTGEVTDASEKIVSDSKVPFAITAASQASTPVASQETAPQIKSDDKTRVNSQPAPSQGNSNPSPAITAPQSDEATAIANPIDKPKVSAKRLKATPSITADIDDLVAKIEAEENAANHVDLPFTEEELQKLFSRWRKESTSPTFKSAVDNCKVSLVGEDRIVVKTPSEIFVDMLRQETKMIEEIHQLYPKRDLNIKFMSDRNAFPGYKPPEKIRLFSTIEKYDRFKSMNPYFEEFVVKFKLKPT